MAMKVIDVSSANGRLDWDAIQQTDVEGAIIRIGWGDDIESQDDSQADRNMDECERLGIPYGVYLYSYAINDDNLQSEIDHMLRMIEGRSPELGVWFDMEDADGYKERHSFSPEEHGDTLTRYCVEFVEEMHSRGYRSGVYANLYYFRNIINKNEFETDDIWVACWGPDEPPINCGMWQYTSDADIEGSSDRTDVSWCYFEPGDRPEPAPRPTPSGGDTIDVYYRVYADGRWLPEAKNLEDFAGIEGEAIEAICIRTSEGYAHYRIHDADGWHAYVSTNNADINDYDNGYAGAGKPIDALEVYFYTPEIKTPRVAKYRASALHCEYYDWQRDNQTSNGQDGYAGDCRNWIDRVQIVIE